MSDASKTGQGPHVGKKKDEDRLMLLGALPVWFFGHSHKQCPPYSFGTFCPRSGRIFQLGSWKSHKVNEKI